MGSKLVKALENYYRICGRKALAIMFIGLVSSVTLGVIEVLITALFQLLFKSLGLLSAETSLIFDSQDWNFSTLQLGAGFIFLAALRGVSSLLTVTTGESVHYFVNARLRMLSLKELLLDENSKYVSAAESNIKISELYPTTAKFCHVLSTMASTGIQILTLVASMLYLSFECSLVGFAGIVLIFYSTKGISRGIRRVAKEIPQQQAVLARGIERISRNWLLVKILRTGDLEYNILKKSVFDYTSKCIRSRVLAGISNQLPIFLGVVLAVVIIVLNDKYFQTQASAFVSFLYIFVRFSQSLGTLSGAVSNSLSYLPQYQMIEKFVVKNWSEQTSKTLDETSEIRVFRQTGNKTKESLKIAESGEAAYSEREPPAIELKRVSFTYDFHNYVLEDFSLKVPKGSQCGIRGPSGSGKSTLLGLITGVIKPTSGDIRVDGEEPSKYFSNRSSQIGYVGPEPYMIEGTLLDNLNYGHRRTVNQTECLEVLEKVGLLPMFNSLRLGFDHPILENGDGLSAGQKQRLSLARALIGHPQILILDEASSNLDDESEKKIAETVDLLKGETTVVVVSHRAGLLKNADFVLDFSPGVK